MRAPPSRTDGEVMRERQVDEQPGHAHVSQPQHVELPPRVRLQGGDHELEREVEVLWQAVRACREQTVTSRWMGMQSDSTASLFRTRRAAEERSCGGRLDPSHLGCEAPPLPPAWGCQQRWLPRRP